MWLALKQSEINNPAQKIAITPLWIKYWIEQISAPIKNNTQEIIDNIYFGIDFKNELSLKEFENNLELFYQKISLNSIKNKEELDIILDLYKKINNYIIYNTNSIINWLPQSRVWIIMIFNDIHETIINRLFSPRFKIDANTTNILIKEIDHLHITSYDLIAPFNYKKLPSKMNSDKLVTKLKSKQPKEFLRDRANFYMNITEIKKYFEQIIVNEWENLESLNYHQLNELLIRVNKLWNLIKEITESVNYTDEEEDFIGLELDNKRNSLKFIDKHFIWKSREMISIKLLDINLKSIITENKDLLTNTSTEYKDTLKSNTSEFSNFINTYRELKLIILKNSTILWKLEKELLQSLNEIIENVKNILQYLIEKSPENVINPLKYNCSREYSYIESVVLKITSH